MRQLLLAVFGVVALAGVASAQQPRTYSPPAAPTYSPATVAGAPVQAASGATVIRGNGCSNCGPTTGGGFKMVGGGDCKYGHACQNGCGSIQSDLAFHFGSCKNFFAPCGPTGGGCLWGSKCGTLPFAQPWGTGWGCPRPYDSYANH